MKALPPPEGTPNDRIIDVEFVVHDEPKPPPRERWVLTEDELYLIRLWKGL